MSSWTEAPLRYDLAEHRLLGDGAGAALVLPDATIDWWCGPSFASEPVLWSLLDPAGATAEFEGAQPDGCDDRPAGPTTTTWVRVSGRRIGVRDGLVDGRVIRLVTSPDGGPFEIVHRAALGGFGTAGGPEKPVEIPLSLEPQAAVEIRPDSVRLINPAAAAATLDEAEKQFRRSTGGLQLPVAHPERVTHALAVMWACTDRHSGGTVAAPTTSLPEAPGHDRQFDYRYAWLRDGSLAAAIATLVGRPDRATGHLRFLCSLGDRVFEAPLFTVDGGPAPDEQEVEHVAGWRSSRPVRVGNAAKTQVQFDALGFVVDAVAVAVGNGASLDGPLWDIVRAAADRACGWDEERPSNGIWELRRPRPIISADIGRWITLDRAIRLARRHRPWIRRRHWKAARNHCRERILSELRPDGRLPQTYGGSPDEPDASALLIPMYGILDARDPRSSQLIDAHLDRLSAGPFVYRYLPTTDDGFAGREGAFVPCSWWAVSALARTGRIDEAKARADELCSALPALLPEEVDPDSGASLGNTPLLWSHAECARALYLLEQRG